MSKISEIKDSLLEKIEKSLPNATIDEIEKLSAALSHLDTVEKFDMSKLYEGFAKESAQSREDMLNFHNELLNVFSKKESEK